MPKPDTRETFIAKARQKHGTKYDYSRVRYVNSTTAVEIVCPVHGVFTQTPNKHLQGKGCRACGYESNAEDKRKSTEQFIEEARRVHGDRYGYAKTVYRAKESKVIITCPRHGEFEQLANNHLRGAGCPECYEERRGDTLRLTTEDFISKAREAHGDRYDYSHTVYTGSTQEVTIRCREHGEFRQRPYDHLYGHGCPKCSASAREKQIMAWLDAKGIDYLFDETVGDCRNSLPLRFDFVLTGRNIHIEHQGIQHYEEGSIGFFEQDKQVRQQRDQIKREYCREHGIRLIEIRYDEDIAQRLSKELSV